MNEKRRPLQQTREQERANHAWGNVETIKDGEQQRYGTLARRLPTMIQVNGLGQTCVFLLSKAKGDRKKPEHLLYKHLSTWVLNTMPENTKTPQDLMAWIREQDSEDYRRATTEALAYALWLRRFVEAKGWGSAEESE